ncbi:MAG: pyruvate formate lyase family protein [bacterium]
MKRIIPAHVTAHLLLQYMAANFNLRPRYKKYLKSTEGWIDFSVGFRTQNDSIAQSIKFKKGRAQVYGEIIKDIDAAIVFEDDESFIEMLSNSSEEVMLLLLKNKIRIRGNHLCVLLFYYFMSLLTDELEKNGIVANGGKPVKKAKPAKPAHAANERPSMRPKEALSSEGKDPGVKFLDDPHLSKYTLEDFPRLGRFLADHFDTMPEVCPERGKLLTDWYIKNGFERKTGGGQWVPELRQAYAFKYLMENKKTIIRENDLIAGTTTTMPIGAVMYPDSQGMFIWPELRTMSTREMNPCRISKKTARILHHHVFPYWMRRNIKLWVYEKYNNPLCEQIGDNLIAYTLSKSVALSHTIADFPKMLALGGDGIRREIADEIERTDPADERKINTLKAMSICLEGVDAYAKNLSLHAAKTAASTADPKRKKELERLSEICARVPMAPPETLDEAINAIWIVWVSLHMENTNIGLSLGRMDQWLQPFFISDISKLDSAEDREYYIKRVIKLVSCFYLRCADHIPMSPDVGKHVVGGAPANQAITLGGVTPDGEDAVNDMTYIFLKVTELLAVRDPNVNARYNPDKNSDTFLKRLCEVNLITTASPSMHNDNAVMASLNALNYPIEDLRDWSSTGCVEPTLSGKHIGHTGCMMMNVVAALEMALNNGRHPLMRWDVGPKTGKTDNGDFETFEQFFSAFQAQFEFLIANATQYNNYLGEAHSVMRPTPLLSSMISDCIPRGIDLTKGGARHNSSGIACIGLADVTDSLLAIKKFVFDDKVITFSELKDAVDSNFKKYAILHAMIVNRTPRFGSGSAEAIAMANRIAKITHDAFASHKNFRGGVYTTGFWSMSNHVAFGMLTGALPSGRLAGLPFTPGLTPQACASVNLLDNIHDVAKLDPRNMSNNIAFNIKVFPAAGETHEKSVNDIFSYVKTYFNLGGMQIQLNVVNTETLRNAMAHPEDYQNLLVRISGYNAYFTTLTKELQTELINRAEFGI